MGINCVYILTNLSSEVQHRKVIRGNLEQGHARVVIRAKDTKGLQR